MTVLVTGSQGTWAGTWWPGNVGRYVVAGLLEEAGCAP